MVPLNNKYQQGSYSLAETEKEKVQKQLPKYNQEKEVADQKDVHKMENLL